MSKINFADKSFLNENADVPEVNKVTDNNINEIKSVVNGNDDIVGDLTNLDTETKTSIVDAINELKNAETYSINEVKTNKVYIDRDGIEHDVYRAEIEASIQNPGTTTINHNLGIVTLVTINASGTVSGQTVSSNGWRMFPMYSLSNNALFQINNIKTNTIEFDVNVWYNNKAYVTIEYTKD